MQTRDEVERVKQGVILNNSLNDHENLKQMALYCNLACSQSAFCLELQTDESYGQNEPLASFLN